MTGQRREDIPAAPGVRGSTFSFPINRLDRVLSQASDKKWESSEKGKISGLCLGHAERVVLRNELKEEKEAWLQNIFPRHS